MKGSNSIFRSVIVIVLAFYNSDLIADSSAKIQAVLDSAVVAEGTSFAQAREYLERALSALHSLAPDSRFVVNGREMSATTIMDSVAPMFRERAGAEGDLFSAALYLAKSFPRVETIDPKTGQRHELVEGTHISTRHSLIFALTQTSLDYGDLDRGLKALCTPSLNDRKYLLFSRGASLAARLGDKQLQRELTDSALATVVAKQRFPKWYLGRFDLIYEAVSPLLGIHERRALLEQLESLATLPSEEASADLRLAEAYLDVDLSQAVEKARRAADQFPTWSLRALLSAYDRFVLAGDSEGAHEALAVASEITLGAKRDDFCRLALPVVSAAHASGDSALTRTLLARGRESFESVTNPWTHFEITEQLARIFLICGRIDDVRALIESHLKELPKVPSARARDAWYPVATNLYELVPSYGPLRDLLQDSISTQDFSYELGQYIHTSIRTSNKGHALRVIARIRDAQLRSWMLAKVASELQDIGASTDDFLTILELVKAPEDYVGFVMEWFQEPYDGPDPSEAERVLVAADQKCKELEIPQQLDYWLSLGNPSNIWLKKGRVKFYIDKATSTLIDARDSVLMRIRPDMIIRIADAQHASGCANRAIQLINRYLAISTSRLIGTLDPIIDKEVAGCAMALARYGELDAALQALQFEHNSGRRIEALGEIAMIWPPHDDGLTSSQRSELHAILRQTLVEFAESNN